MNSHPGSKGAQQPFAIGGEPKSRIEITDAVVETATDEQRIYCWSAECDIARTKRYGKLGGKGRRPCVQRGIIRKKQRTAADRIGPPSSGRIGFGDRLKGTRGKQIITIELADYVTRHGTQTEVQSVVDSRSRRLDKANVGPAAQKRQGAVRRTAIDNQMLAGHSSGAADAVESSAEQIDPIENGGEDRDQRPCHTPAHQGITVGGAWTRSVRRRAKFEKAAAILKRCRQSTAFVVGEPRAPSSKQACLIQMRSCHVIVQHTNTAILRSNV